MNNLLNNFGMSHLLFNSSVGLEFVSTAMDMSYATVENYPEIDPLYNSSPVAVHCYCQPYLDHSYASQLPTVNLDDDHVTALSNDVEQPLLVPYIDIEDVSCNTTVVTAPMMIGKSNDDPYEGSVTRCICDFQHDDGYMICCDRCGVWQHVDCMGVNRNNIPDSYLCELCNPRMVDKRRAIRLQTLKKEQMESEVSGTDSSTEERERSYTTTAGKRGGRKRQRMGRKAARDQNHSQTPATVTPSAPAPVPARAPAPAPVPARTPAPVPAPTLAPASHYPPQGSKRVRRRTTSEPNDDMTNNAAQANTQNDQPLAPKRTRRSTNDFQRNVTIDHSIEDVCHNSFTNGVLNLLTSMKQNKTDVSTPPSNSALFKKQMNKQRYHLTHYDPDAKGIEAVETIKVNQAIAEYTGHVILTDEYQLDNQLNVSKPFILTYASTDSIGLNVYIDSSGQSSNDIRFIRCSCTPNAKVLHVIEENTIRFYICATKNIAEGREITIPFSDDYQKSSLEVKCACDRVACSIAKFFKNKTNSRPIRTGRRRKSNNLSISEEDKTKADTLPASAAAAAAPSAEADAVTIGNNDNLTNPPPIVMMTGVKQRRRSSFRSETIQQDQNMNEDINTDITLMNQLADVMLPVTLTSCDNSKLETSASLSVITNEKEQLKNTASIIISKEVQHGNTSNSSDQDEPETGSLVIAIENDVMTPSKKTREQKKIEAVEKVFEKIDKLNSRGRETNLRLKSNRNNKVYDKTMMRNEEKGKRTPNSKNKNLSSTEMTKRQSASVSAAAASAAAAATNGGGGRGGVRTSMRSKKLRGGKA